jgi:hypothetical protein
MPPSFRPDAATNLLSRPTGGTHRPISAPFSDTCDCAMVPTPFSTDDETWPLMAVLTWIATRSLTFTESYAARDILDAQDLLRVAREGYGTPFNIGYGEAFHSLNKNIDEQKITGLGTKLKWIVPAKNEQLPIDQCFAQAERLKFLNLAFSIRKNW